MAELEKVVKGLECCDNDECDICPYDRSCDENDLGTCRATLHRDALALLKAQEPRVMTLEEVAGRVALEEECTIYMEFGYLATKDGEIIGLNPKYMWFDDEHGLSWNVVEGPDKGKRDSVSLYEYNVIWRCWASRPTDEQREAIPWE